MADCADLLKMIPAGWLRNKNQWIRLLQKLVVVVDVFDIIEKGFFTKVVRTLTLKLFVTENQK